MRILTNPEILLLQSRLYNPTFHANGRWVMLDPRTIRAFAAVGKDSFPQVLTLLQRLSKPGFRIAGGERENYLESYNAVGLLQAGLLITDDRLQEPPSLTAHYHLAATDYPFFDYHDPDWRAKDLALMKSYATISPPPPNYAPRSGNRFNLPGSDILSGGLPLVEPQTSLLEIVGRALRFCFGARGEIPGGDFGPWLRKTSPSGGARHPTECTIYLSHSLGHIPAGLFVYDSEQHQLCAVRVETVTGEELKSPLGSVVFLIRSRVERAMWRYRDLRAFRPVLLDAGHVLETLHLYLTANGLATAILPPPRPPAQSFEWLAEPCLATLVAAPKVDSWALEQPTASPKHHEPILTSYWVTNPSLWLTIRRGNLNAHVIWPEKRDFVISRNDFLVLNNCLPSKRGDRPTQGKSILYQLPRTTQKKLERLVREGALVERDYGLAFYRSLEPWVFHNWYLSILMYLEGFARHTAESLSCRSTEQPLFGGNERILTALLERHTTRAFEKSPISRRTLEAVLEELRRGSKDIQMTGLRVFLAASRVVGLKPALYEIVFTNDKLKYVTYKKLPAPESVQALTVGQASAATGAATIWLAVECSKADALAYRSTLIALGRIGQRLCSGAAAEQLGVFLTPAVKDSDVATLLALNQDYIFYFFALGESLEQKHANPTG